MKCEQVQSLLVSYLNHETTPSEQVLLQAHLSGCADCREELDRVAKMRDELSVALQRRAAQAEPSAEAWDRLQARLAREAQPAQTHWFSRLALGVNHTIQQIFGGATMRNKYLLAAGMAALSIATVGIFMFNSVTQVSAQTVLERASAAQAADTAADGIHHSRIEIYSNPLALTGANAGSAVIDENYEDPTNGRYRYVTRDENGNILQASSVDKDFDYSLATADDGALTIERRPLSPDEVIKRIEVNTGSVTAHSVFEQFRGNPKVELLGKETYADGRSVYILIDRNYQTEKSTDGQLTETLLGSVSMTFDAQSFALLESKTSVVKDGQEIVMENVKFTVDEVLAADAPVAWDLSDLPGATYVDLPAQDERQADEALPEPISMEELAQHAQTYALATVPAGYTVEIYAAPNQPADQPYTYEIIYRGPEEAEFSLLATGYMDPGFIETNFYDGSYKAPNGMTLYFSISRPANAGQGSSAILVAPDGVSFLLLSSLERPELQTLIEDLVPLQ